MKSILFFIFYSFCFTVYSQHVEWSKEIPTGIQKAHFIDDRLCIIGAIHDTVKIDSITYSWSTPTTSFLASLKKDGVIDTVFKMSNFIPGDFIKGNSGYYITGWGPFSFCFSKSEFNGNIAWSDCYNSHAPYDQHSPYYPFTEAVTIIEHKNSLYVIGNYEDSLLFGNQWMYGSRSLLAKVNPLSGNIHWAKNIPPCKKIIDFKNATFLLGSNLYGNALFDTISVQLQAKGIVVSRTDTMGTFISAKVIAERATMIDMVVDANQNIFITGEFKDSCKIGNMPYVGKIGGFFLLKTDNVGSVIWAKTFLSPKPNFGGYPFSLAVAPDNSVFLSGGFYLDSLNLQDTILIGTKYSGNAFITKFSSSGGFDFGRSFTSTGGCSLNEVTVDDDGSVYWWGRFMGQIQIGNNIYESPPFIYSCYLAKVSVTNWVGIEDKEKQNVLLYPNPSSRIFTLNLNNSNHTTLSLYDVLGNCLSRKDCRQSILQIDLSLQSKGVYFMEIVSNGERVVKKIVLQ